MLEFISVCTVTNGVLLTEANKGQRVVYRSVMQTFRTGRIHRVMDASGYYTGDEVINGTVYAMFERGYIGDKFQKIHGLPLAFFTPESRGIDIDELMRSSDVLL
jgi:hypothetical protein